MVSATFSSLPGRREERRHERREAILDVAQQSFLEQGYDGTTMSAIAAALGGSKGTLWSYFASKDLLFAAVLDRATEQFRKGLATALDFSSPIKIALGEFCRQFLRTLTLPEAAALHRLVVGETQRFPEVGRIFFERGPGRTRKLLADYLGAAMERGQLRRDDPVAAAEQLTGLCLGGCHMQLLLGLIGKAGPAEIEADVRRALAVFMRAYAPA